MDIEQLIRRVEATGSRLWVVGDKLRVDPAPPPALLNALRAERQAVLHFVKVCGRYPGERVGGVDLQALRKYCPLLFEVITAPNGHEALLWGVTAHGLIVSYDHNRPLFTVKP